ncbi:MAG: recombinase family protein [Oscillospiraceae bacterium]|nr:recombinase family protein [Oscillospiraceae bacterium]
MNKTFGYARVSTTEQHLDRQIDALIKAGIDERNIVTDKASGKDMNREGYQSLKNQQLRDGDTLIIKSLDRLSRNKAHIRDELEYFKAHHIRLMVLDLPTTMIAFPEGQEWVFEMINNILIEVLSSIAEQERNTIRQRQAEGLVLAKEKGKHLGRPKATLPMLWDSYYPLWKRGIITAKDAMEGLKLKRTTFYKLVQQYEQSKEA